MTNDLNKPVWQWPYSAFGTTKPTGILKATAKPKNAMTNQPVLLKGTVPPQRFDLRYPGQTEDVESGTFQNIWRSYWDDHGRYTQADPLGQVGGPNRFTYAENLPTALTDPMGLQATVLGPGGIPVPIPVPLPGAASPSELARELDKIFCPPEPGCWELQGKMEEVAGELRQRHVSMTADVNNLYCTRSIGKISWMGHQMKFNDKQRQLQRLTCPQFPYQSKFQKSGVCKIN